MRTPTDRELAAAREGLRRRGYALGSPTEGAYLWGWADSTDWIASQAPTDAEVEAARQAITDLLVQLGVDPDEKPEHGGPTPGEVIARAALVAARLAPEDGAS